MPSRIEETRGARILAFLSTQSAPVGIGAIIAGAAEPGESSDAARWTSWLSALGSQVEVSGNYRKKYALARSEPVAIEEPHGGLNITAMLRPRSDEPSPTMQASVEVQTPRLHGRDPQTYGTAPAISDYDAAAEFFGAAPAGPAVVAMLATGEDPAEPEDVMRKIVTESLRQESELRGVPEHLLTGAESPPPEVLAEARIPIGTYFSETFGNFYDANTGFGMGPQFKERWWVRRDEFPTADDYGHNSDESVETSTSYDDAVGKSSKNTVLRQQPGSSKDPDWLEVREVYRAAVRIRAANTGWGVDMGLDADVREARALLAEVRHQLATDAPLGEHYREDDEAPPAPTPERRSGSLREPGSVDLGGGDYYVQRAANRYEWRHDRHSGWIGVFDSVDKIRDEIAALRRVHVAPPRPASSDEQPWAE